MSIVKSVTTAIPPVNPAGYPFIGGTILLALVLGMLWAPLFWLLAILAGWMIVFFRDPERVTPDEPGFVISPADGRIEPIAHVPPPPELGMGQEPTTVVLIEDDPLTRRLYATQLELAGHVVREFDSGPAALEAVDDSVLLAAIKARGAKVEPLCK